MNQKEEKREEILERRIWEEKEEKEGAENQSLGKNYHENYSSHCMISCLLSVFYPNRAHVREF